MNLRHLLFVGGVAGSGGLETARAQDTTAREPDFILEARVGQTEALGGTSRTLVGPDAAVGVTFAFQLSQRVSGWLSADFRPSNVSTMYRDGTSPAVEFYALTGGLSRTFGLPFLPSRWRPFELGFGIGATQTAIETRANSYSGVPLLTPEGTTFPPDAEFERVFDTALWSSTRWRPTAAVRLRMALPLGPLRLSATAGVLATPVGDVRLWDGRWESAEDGTSYRPTSKVWSFGTVYTAPLTIGLGVRF